MDAAMDTFNLIKDLYNTDGELSILNKRILDAVHLKENLVDKIELLEMDLGESIPVYDENIFPASPGHDHNYEPIYDSNPGWN